RRQFVNGVNVNVLGGNILAGIFTIGCCRLIPGRTSTDGRLSVVPSAAGVLSGMKMLSGMGEVRRFGISGVTMLLSRHARQNSMRKGKRKRNDRQETAN